MHLEKWIELAGKSRHDVAEAIGVTVGLIGAFIRKEKRLGDENKRRLYEFTEGAVTYDDMIIPDEELKKAPNGD